MISLLIATRNAHKIGEIRAILGDGFRCLTLNDFPNPPEVIEDAATFAGNATRKSVALANWVSVLPALHRQPSPAIPGKAAAKRRREAPTSSSLAPNFPDYVLADDSGLEVDALAGAPGVHSARFAALDSGHSGNSSAAENNTQLLHLLQDVPPDRRTARFRCVIALTPVLPPAPNENASPACCANECELQTELFDGTCEGRILAGLRGRGGFGYDPLFVPAGYELSFGELPEEVKNRLSHRAQALAKLKQWLLQRLNP